MYIHDLQVVDVLCMNIFVHIHSHLVNVVCMDTGTRPLSDVHLLNAFLHEY